jgi:hypothetical membrane protein
MDTRNVGEMSTKKLYYGREYTLFGVTGPLIAYIFIGIAIMLSPWFSWQKNA